MEKRPKAPERLNGIVAVVCNYSAVRVRVCVSASARKRVIMKSHSEESGAGGRVLISLGAHRNFSLARCVCVCVHPKGLRAASVCPLPAVVCVRCLWTHLEYISLSPANRAATVLQLLSRHVGARAPGAPVPLPPPPQLITDPRHCANTPATTDNN